MKFILGKKLGMTQLFRDNGTVVPVTKVQAGPCQIVQVKTAGDKVAIQLGFDEVATKSLSKPEIGHLKDLKPVRVLRDFSVDSDQAGQLKRGQVVSVGTFTEGDKVTVIGKSKGRGFAGVVKRHGFKGGPASHGHKDQLRAPGSIGSTGPQKVFKGVRMAGHMGSGQVTVHNLEVVEIHPESNEIYIKGAVPGARNGLLLIKAEGELKLADDKKAGAKDEPKAEAKPEEKPTAATEEKPAEKVEAKAPEAEAKPAKEEKTDTPVEAAKTEDKPAKEEAKAEVEAEPTKETEDKA